MADESVKFTTSGAVGIITLDSPETRNALTPEMIGALGQAVEQCASPNIRAVLLTGAAGLSAPGPTCGNWWRHWRRAGPTA